MTKSIQLPEGLKLLDEWSKRLGLQDWRIFLFDNVKPEDMDIEDADGSVICYEELKTARIKIVNPEKRPDSFTKFDYEETLVHELMHCKLSLIDEKDTSDTLLSRVVHQLIDDLARALVDAKRSGG